jgi:hypothetical protein
MSGRDPAKSAMDNLSELIIQSHNNVTVGLYRIQEHQFNRIDSLLEMKTKLFKQRENIKQDLLDLVEMQESVRSMDRIDSLEIALKKLVDFNQNHPILQ